MLTDIKYFKKNIKRLCWSDKVETGNAVFMGRVEICVCTYWWCHFGCGVLLSYLDACIMPCVIDARLALLSFGVVCVCVCVF